MAGARLHLGFADAEDLGTVSALVQDAVVKASDLVYLGGMKRFALVANRFCWEAGGQAFRRRCGLHFDTVKTVRAKGIDRTAVEQVLELLAIDVRENENGVTIDLVFAGDAHLRLEAETIEGGLKDLTEPWPTKRAPRHDLSGEPS